MKMRTEAKHALWMGQQTPTIKKKNPTATSSRPSQNHRKTFRFFLPSSVSPPSPPPPISSKAPISNAWSHRWALWRRPASTNNVFNKIWRHGVQSHAKRTWHGGEEGDGERARHVQLLSEMERGGSAWERRGKWGGVGGGRTVGRNIVTFRS